MLHNRRMPLPASSQSLPTPDRPPLRRKGLRSPEALTPLRHPTFRMLWLTWVAANTCMWMNDVASAWMMTSLTASPAMVALVQTASTLPVFLLGLPSGALADILDRRRYFMLTQIWVATVALLLCAVLFMGWMTAPLLLSLTFLNGIGLAMRWPVFAAIVPELVPRAQLPAAMGLNGIAMNASRIIGPLLAGAVIAGLGSIWVFVLNAVLSIGSAMVILRWRREHKISPLGRERLGSAIRVGLQFVRQSPRMRAVLMRVALFFVHAAGLMALLPLVARAMPEGNASTFTSLLASMGCGAIVGALTLPRLRRRWSNETLLRNGSLGLALALLGASFAPHVYLAMPAMAIGGFALLCSANSMTTIAQLCLPDWVRARGMSIYQMALMGGSAIGAALWGQVASLTSLHIGMSIAAASCVLCMLLLQFFLPDRGVLEDLTPSAAFQPPVAKQTPSHGQIQVNIEYFISPLRAEEFRAVMQESRRSRLRQGALDWRLLHDINDPGRFVEQITDESWTEHLRRFTRVTAYDVALRDKKLSFHIDPEPPVVTRLLVEDDRLAN
jgi:MFS family permease